MKVNFRGNSTQERINYAVRVMLRSGQTSRSFDNCFENHDHEAVYAGVWARAQKNPKLLAVFPKYLCMPEVAP